MKRRKDYTLLEIAQGKVPLTEKQVEHTGDRFMADLGFAVVRFSQARATQQTRGIPDRRYYSPSRGVACWWEAKAEGGKQSADQAAFAAMAHGCAETYLLGTTEVLAAWVEAGCPEPHSEAYGRVYERLCPAKYRFKR